MKTLKNLSEQPSHKTPHGVGMQRRTGQNRCKAAVVFFIAAMAFVRPGRAPAATGADVQARMAADVKAGRPLVAHVIVALCDNKHQGIQRVPETLGNGQDPRWNLYWGALLGVKTYLPKHGGWEIVSRTKTPGKTILETIVFHRQLNRGTQEIDVYLVAEAWDGKEIKAAIRSFISCAAGHGKKSIQLEHDGAFVTLQAGGAAHLVAYVGHNGLMEYHLGEVPKPKAGAAPRSSIVLACASKSYFLKPLQHGGSHPLLLTTGLMAPEAYTLDAAVRAWFDGKGAAEIRDAAGAAYHKYQKCGLRAATRLFYVEN